MRRSGAGEFPSDEMVRRIVNLPRNMLAGFSRAVEQGMNLMAGISSGGRPNHPTNFPFHPPSNPYLDNDPLGVPVQYPQQPPIQEEFAFLDSLERQYGTQHPFFYACRFVDALKMARDEHKFVFLYLHSPQHPFASYFCRETLCSELVVQFLDANFVSWGALADRREGLHLATALRASGFPFCAVVAPASGDSMAVLQQIEGPVSPAELVELLQQTIEEQGSAFGSSLAKQEEQKRREDRRLREEQDAAYMAAFQIDQEKEKQNNPNPGNPNRPKSEKLKQLSSVNQQGKVKESSSSSKGEMLQKDQSKGGKNVPATQILIRFPNGERREHTFSCNDSIQAIYRYIDSLGLPGTANYRLISNFPRKVYGVDQMGMTLKDAGLHPKASLFLELL